MTRAIDEPIRPMPISAMVSNIELLCHHARLFRNVGESGDTPRLASAEPMVMRSALGRP
jgi:hypothetical protein